MALVYVQVGVKIELTLGLLGCRSGGDLARNLCVWAPPATKKCDFPHLFSDLAFKIHTRFQTWSLKIVY